MSSRVMMIGLDAGSLDFIEASLAWLPNLRRAIERGVRRRLHSKTSELLHAASWPTLYTGSPPGVHGFYYPMQWDADAMQLRHVRGWMHCEPFWHELERLGRRVVVFDVPMTWPSRLARGVQIVDWGSHDQLSGFSATPAHLAAEVRRRFGRYPLGHEIPVAKSFRQLARMRDELVAGARRKGDLAQWLLAQHQWDFAFTVFGETHRGGHLFWPTPATEGQRHPAGALLDIYRAVDDVIGRLVTSANRDDTTLVIVSAHGMGPNTSQEHLTRPIMDRVNARFDDAGGTRPLAQPGPQQRSVMRLLRERLPAPFQHAVGQALPRRFKDFVVNRAITAGHDWSHTPALAVLGSSTGFVRFNIRGREAHGTLEPGSERHAAYLRWMDECFRSFRIVTTGQPLVKDIVFTSEAFPGARQDRLPDAVISWNGFPASLIHSDLLGTIEVPMTTGRSGNHNPEGFAIVVRRDGEAGVVAPVGDILDIKPMVFRELGLHAPAATP